MNIYDLRYLNYTKITRFYNKEGFTHGVQPLDVAINKPIKDSLKDDWADWMANSTPIWTKCGNRQRPTYDTIVGFVSNALAKLTDPDKIKRAFSCCGLVRWPAFAEFEKFFDQWNHRLKDIIYPDVLNVSHECLASLRRVALSREAIPEYMGMMKFGSSVSPSSTSSPCSSLSPSSTSSPCSSVSSSSTLPRLSVSPSSTSSPCSSVLPSSTSSPCSSVSTSSVSSSSSSFSIKSLLGYLD